ncbi:MAG TPA: sensor histidine kinase [Chloroflexia bacterium]|nr:sensor histidine kinase [Chloroflexia bacterium]
MSFITSVIRDPKSEELSPRRNAATVLLVIGLLTVVPVLITAQFDPLRVLEHAAFAIFMVSAIVFYALVLGQHRTLWSQMLSMLGIWGLAIGFNALFSSELGNAFLVFIVAVQLVFALLGPRFGMGMLALSIAALVADTYFSDRYDLQSRVFTLAVLVTVGILTWVFVYTGKSARERAVQMAAEATKAKNEAELLAREVTRLNRMLLTSQDNERRRLARDIHDGPLQSLGVQLLAVDRVRRRIHASEPDKAETELEYLRQLTCETVTELRGTVNALRNTILSTGLEPAMQSIARKLEEQAGLNVQVAVRVGDDLPKPLQNCLYQLTLEAANNVKKHAGARRMYIGLSYIDGRVELRVKDDGKGFRYEESLELAIRRGHIGLHSMKERATELGGTMQVISSPGHGAEIIFRFRPSYATTTTLADSTQLTDTLPQNLVYMADAHRAS